MTPGNGQREALSPRSAPGRDRPNARGDATRLLILLTAERLFAERGIEAVPLRDIGIAAGQKNNVAVQYHFGNRENLVLAIAEYRAQFLGELSTELAELAASGKVPTITDFVRGFVLGLATNLNRDSHFLAFASRYFVERGGYHGLDATVPAGSTAVLMGVRSRLLPDHPQELLDERWQILFTTAVHTLARYQGSMEAGTLPAPIDDLIEDLVHFLASGLEVPAP